MDVPFACTNEQVFIVSCFVWYSEELDVEDENEKINHLEVEKASAYLVFNQEEEGLFTLRGGPIDALIAYAASTTNDGNCMC